MKLSVRLRGKQSARDKEGCLFSVASAFTRPLKENISFVSQFPVAVARSGLGSQFAGKISFF
jgi:hypothetical protein